MHVASQSSACFNRRVLYLKYNDVIYYMRWDENGRRSRISRDDMRFFAEEMNEEHVGMYSSREKKNMLY